MAYFAPCIDASGIHMPTYEGRLFLLQGEWRENPGIGFPVPEYLREGRVTEADASVLSSRITAYIRETPGVRNVEDVYIKTEPLPCSGKRLR